MCSSISWMISYQWPRWRRLSNSWSMGKSVLDVIWEASVETWGSKDCWSLRWMPGGYSRGSGLYQNHDDPSTFRGMEIASFVGILTQNYKSCFYILPFKFCGVISGFSDIRGWYARQMCCYYCRALAWIYEGDGPETANFLYTNFGTQAAHRNTFPCKDLFSRIV